MFIHGKNYVGIFNTIDYIYHCTVKSQGKVVFFGIVRNLEYYAGFRYTEYCTEEGLFEKGCLKHGYKQMNGELSNAGDPNVYEEAYTSEGMTFRNTRPSIKASSESKDSLKSKGQKSYSFPPQVDSGYIEEERKKIPVIIPLNPHNGKINSGSISANADEDGASSLEQPNLAFPIPVDQSPANQSSVNRASEDYAKTVSPQPQPGSSKLNATIPLSKQQQIPTSGPQPEDTPYTLTKNGDSYYLNNERVSVELEDNETTVLVPYNHNNEDNHATKIYLKFTRKDHTFDYDKTVIRMPSPLCSIKHPKSYSDAYTRGPPDRRRPPHAERRSSPQGCTRPTQYPAFARPCTP